MLMLRIPAGDDDIASVSRRELRGQFQIRIVGVVVYEEPGLLSSGQLSFDAVDILVHLKQTCHLSKALLNLVVATHIDL